MQTLRSLASRVQVQRARPVNGRRRTSLTRAGWCDAGSASRVGRGRGQGREPTSSCGSGQEQWKREASAKAKAKDR